MCDGRELNPQPAAAREERDLVGARAADEPLEHVAELDHAAKAPVARRMRSAPRRVVEGRLLVAAYDDELRAGERRVVELVPLDRVDVGARGEPRAVDDRPMRVRGEDDDVGALHRSERRIDRRRAVVGREDLELLARRRVDPNLGDVANLAQPLELSTGLPPGAEHADDARLTPREAVRGERARRADAHPLQVAVLDDRDRRQQLEIEEQYETHVPLARRRRNLHPPAVALVGQVRRQPERMHADPRQAAVHRLEEVVPVVAAVGVRVRAGTVDGVAVRVIDERRFERVDRVAHAQHAAHVGVVEQKRHDPRVVYGLTIEPRWLDRLRPDGRRDGRPSARRGCAARGIRRGTRGVRAARGARCGRVRVAARGRGAVRRRPRRRRRRRADAGGGRVRARRSGCRHGDRAVRVDPP
jgi:hypothetical protein